MINPDEFASIKSLTTDEWRIYVATELETIKRRIGWMMRIIAVVSSAAGILAVQWFARWILSGGLIVPGAGP